MRGGRIQKIHILTSDKSRDKPFSDYVGEFHLRYVERRLSELPLSTQDKLDIIDSILKNIKEEASI